ncbi:MAG TPA: methylenetetrahydrofolate reductase C-terminal domain-containing protein [bacterium]|nr:methylenetetrahydrofolate reductase C-terminal domain-containing protein [bacterium]
MLVTRIKNEAELKEAFSGRTLAISCHGCREVFFPEDQVEKALNQYRNCLVGAASLDYLCREDFSQVYLQKMENLITQSSRVVIFSCGVGVQVWAKLLPGKIVLAGCNSFNINGFQGLTPTRWNCHQCGECWLNTTAAICPLTACSKGLLNGPCGGAKNGKCEVHPSVDCGWHLIYERTQATGQKFLPAQKVAVRDYRRLVTGTTTREG